MPGVVWRGLGVPSRLQPLATRRQRGSGVQSSRCSKYEALVEVVPCVSPVDGPSQVPVAPCFEQMASRSRSDGWVVKDGTQRVAIASRLGPTCQFSQPGNDDDDRDDCAHRCSCALRVPSRRTLRFRLARPEAGQVLTREGLPDPLGVLNCTLSNVLPPSSAIPACAVPVLAPGDVPGGRHGSVHPRLPSSW